MKDLTPEQALYIQNNSPVGSSLWTDAGLILAGYQRQFHANEEYRRQNPTELELLAKERKGEEEGMRVISNQVLPEIYTQAIILSRANKQTIGENNDYYITLEQLEKILIAVRDGPTPIIDQ